jgi:RNase P subunit RPR2
MFTSSMDMNPNHQIPHLFLLGAKKVLGLSSHLISSFCKSCAKAWPRVRDPVKQRMRSDGSAQSSMLAMCEKQNCQDAQQTFDQSSMGSNPFIFRS